MANGFFSYFPSVTYAQKVAKNLLVSSKMRASVLDNPKAFFKYLVKPGESPEMVALRFYDDAKYDWLVYFANNIVDPYHDWPKEYLEFKRFIEQKYGSVPQAKATTVHYKHNDYDFTINQDTYDRLVDAEFVDTSLQMNRVGWVAVDAYTYEDELNEEKSAIQIIHPQFVSLIEEEIRGMFE